MVPPSFFAPILRPTPVRKEKNMKKQAPAPAPTQEIYHDRVGMFKEATEAMRAVYERKNHDYGNSFAEARRKIPYYTLGKLYDKVSQLIALSRDEETDRVFSAAVDNALRDLADCALAEYVERRFDEAVAHDF